jgi:putative thymidine phosphorylase
MKLKIKKVDINTGYMVCFINEEDAKAMDLRQGERIRISKNKNSVTCIVDTSKSNKIIKKGFVGLLDEAYDSLGLPNNTEVKIALVEKPLSLHYIKNKMKGIPLKKEEIEAIIQDIVDGNYSDIEITYFVSACYIHELSMEEVINLTNAIINTGEILKPKKTPVLDKHCIGGVAGNRTTPIAVPILASLGYTVPKTSSRSITSPAGTADTLEVLCSVCFSKKEMEEIVEKTNACLTWGGALNMAPADDRIIKVEHPISLDPVGQLLASILAKKKAVSATHLLIDIPYGNGAKIEDYNHARSLKKKFEEVSKHLDLKIKVIITDGSQPIGNGIGPVLEARDILWVFERNKNAPKDLEEKGIHLAARLVELTGDMSYKNALKICTDCIEDGSAHKKFIEILKMQKGKIFESKNLKLSKFKKYIKADKNGIITQINNKVISRVARICGAPQSQTAGIYLNVHIGDKVKKGDNLMTLYAENKDKLKYAGDFYKEIKGIKIEK